MSQHNHGAGEQPRGVPDAEWKLVIVSPVVSSSGLLKAYGRVLRYAPEHKGIFWPSMIRLERPEDPTVDVILKVVRDYDQDWRYGDQSVYVRSSSLEPFRLYDYRA